VAQQINLYNPLFLKQEKYFSARTMVQALGLIVLGLSALYVYALVQTGTSERLGREYRDQVGAQRDQFVKLSGQLSPHGGSKELEADVARLESEVKMRKDLLNTLGSGELGNGAGFSGFMAAFGRQTVPGVWLTGFTVSEAGNDLRLRGRVLRADLVPTYLRALNNEPLMRGRRVTEMKLEARAPSGSARARAEPGKYLEFTLAVPLRVADTAAKGAAQ
jgi:type IV pilus assembly PilN-like protein